MQKTPKTNNAMTGGHCDTSGTGSEPNHAVDERPVSAFEDSASEDTVQAWHFGWATVVAGVAILLSGALFFISTAPWAASLPIFACLAVLSFYDIHTYRLPNLFTGLFLLCSGLVVYGYPRWPVDYHLIGLVVGLLFFPLLNSAYRALRGRDGVGMGDAKLLAGIGLLLGWPGLPLVLFVASLCGLLYALVLTATTKGITNTTRLPFGPFLCFGAWVGWLFF